MIILDTNIVSEPMKQRGHPAVLNWLDQQLIETLFFTAVGLSELLLGVKLLPEGKRKHALHAAVTKSVMTLFGPRVFSFDRVAAEHYAQIMSLSKAMGRPISSADAQIAAIAIVHDCPVATRDTTPYLVAGVRVIDPWRM